MKKLIVGTLALLSLAVPKGTVRAESGPGGADLPVRRIILFRSGVGYFQREGAVDGDGRVDLNFPTASINDLIKSLVLQDLGGGRISTVHYDNHNPVEKTLQSFAIDLNNNPGLAQILGQARGERVEVHLGGAGETPVKGLIVSLERKPGVINKGQGVIVEQLNLLTDDGLRGVSLEAVRRVRFLKPEMEREFRKALAALAANRGKDKKTVTLNFHGEGQRKVRVGYVLESPVWKTTYRLALKKGRLFLQGWAVVENTTDEDWSGVQLGLVSGRPISFQMNLYDPLFVTRPFVQHNLFASLMPQTYGGNLGWAGCGMGSAPASAAAWPPINPPPQPCLGAPAACNNGNFTNFNRSTTPSSPQDSAARLGQVLVQQNQNQALNFQQSVTSAATAAHLGEYVHYRIDQPVTLPRQKSALLPIVNRPITGKKVSIYNKSVHPKHPLCGLSFKNTTKLHLTPGPVTVFEDSGYAGDARLDDVQPGETRLLSYAVDLGTEVEPAPDVVGQVLQTVRVEKGILLATYKDRRTRAYTVKNRLGKARLVWVEQPFEAGWKLVGGAKAVERSREYYRFEVKAAPHATTRLEVVEERPNVQQVMLSSCDDGTIRVYLRAGQSSKAVKATLKHLLDLKAKLAESERTLAAEQAALSGIVQDQERMRANIARVPKDSRAYQRYLKKFDDQETAIEKHHDRIARLQAAVERQRKALQDYVVKLDVND
jgi:hypothetical protein